MSDMNAIRAAFLGFGEVNSPQDLIKKKCGDANKKLNASGFSTEAVYPITDAPGNENAKAALKLLGQEDWDVVIVCLAGWISSHAVIALTEQYAHKPIILWGLTGYTDGGRLITTADQAGTSALRKVFQDLGYKFFYIYSSIDNPFPEAKLKEAGLIARSQKLLKSSKAGMLGVRDMNLYGTMWDCVSLKKKIGPEVESFDLYELDTLSKNVQQADVDAVRGIIQKEWSFIEKPAEESIRKGIRYYCALKRKIEERGYAALSLNDVEGMKKFFNFPPAMIFTLIGRDPGIPTVPENDVPGMITQLICHYLTGQISPYFEFYEYFSDRLLVGVPDFVPPQITDGPVTFTATKFGLLTEGILNVSKVKTGEVTLCRLTHAGDTYAMHILEGQAVAARKWEEAGWTPPAPQLPSLEIIPDTTTIENFAEQVLSQHYILLYGRHMNLLKKFCRFMDIDVIQ